MTEIAFHTGLADPLDFACRLLRKALRQGARVLVTAPPETLSQLDRLLWTFEERDFVPHVRLPGAPAATVALTPLWLAPGPQGLIDVPGVRVNLDGEPVRDFQGVERLIEIVGAQPEAAARGRERWRAYVAAGHAPQHHHAGSHG